MLVVKVYMEKGKSEYWSRDFQGGLKIGYRFEIGGLRREGAGWCPSHRRNHSKLQTDLTVIELSPGSLDLCKDCGNKVERSIKSKYIFIRNGVRSNTLVILTITLLVTAGHIERSTVMAARFLALLCT